MGQSNRSINIVMKEIVDIVDLDCIYLSFDEPKKEEFWVRIQDMFPWAKRVDGVLGSDSAHKAAAELSETERFILIDGDNLPNSDFFNISLEITDENKNAQFRWRAKNHINGLHYGNGGMSSWTKTFVRNMKTHENTIGTDQTNIEFCYDPMYWAMHDCYSVTYPNQSAKHAWRAGFREGVKMCTRSGVVPPNKEQFLKWVWPTCMKNLIIWQTLGRDVEHGFWAILGARLGTHYLMLRDWDHTEVRDFEKLNELWELHKNDDEVICKQIATELNKHLELNIIEIDEQQSNFFKNYIHSEWHNLGPMVKESDVLIQRH